MSADQKVSGNERLDALQLDLFPAETEQSGTRGISRAVARAGVSPGWWPIVDRLFGMERSLAINVCRDVDGELELTASLAGDEAEPLWLAPYLSDVRATASRTCCCCGVTSAARARPRLDAPACVACERCRARFRAGEAILRIAEDFWHFDGSPRLRPINNRVADAARASIAAPKKRQCTALAPEELREVITEFRQILREDLAGQDQVADRLALISGLHVGGDLPLGARALLIGRSGTGKSTAIGGLLRGIQAGNWDVPIVVTEAIDLTSPGWAGISIGDLIEAAIGDDPQDNGVDSVRARHCVVVLEEVHHIGMSPDLTGTMAAKRQEVLSSVLPLVGYGMLHLGDGTREWSSRNALVIGVGAFSGLLDVDRAPSIRDLTKAGLPIELASRFEEVLVLRQFDEAALRRVLKTWPALLGLISVCERLGYKTRIHDEAISRASRAVLSGHDGSTPRTAGGWLVAALRDALMSALGDPKVRELAITPDSLAIARAALRSPPPDDPPEPFGPWDATIVLTPR